jgi:hypothetical protein
VSKLQGPPASYSRVPLLVTRGSFSRYRALSFVTRDLSSEYSAGVPFVVTQQGFPLLVTRGSFVALWASLVVTGPPS